MVVDRIGCAGSNCLDAIVITMHCRLTPILRALVLSIACGGLGLLAHIWLTGLQPAAVLPYLKDAEMGINAVFAPRLFWEAGQSLHGIVCWPATVPSSKFGGTAVQSNLVKLLMQLFFCRQSCLATCQASFGLPSCV